MKKTRPKSFVGTELGLRPPSIIIDGVRARSHGPSLSLHVGNAGVNREAAVRGGLPPPLCSSDTRVEKPPKLGIFFQGKKICYTRVCKFPSRKKYGFMHMLH
jgi:hypothetical protein